MHGMLWLQRGLDYGVVQLTRLGAITGSTTITSSSLTPPHSTSCFHIAPSRTPHQVQDQRLSVDWVPPEAGWCHLLVCRIVYHIWDLASQHIHHIVCILSLSGLIRSLVKVAGRVLRVMDEPLSVPGCRISRSRPLKAPEATPLEHTQWAPVTRAANQTAPFAAYA
jgi:hypothetical protein